MFAGFVYTSETTNQHLQACTHTRARAKQDGRDIWRDSALRYAGYANEVGESFRNIAPRLVVPSCESYSSSLSLYDVRPPRGEFLLRLLVVAVVAVVIVVF